MKQSYQAKLTVNKKELEMNPFVESFVSNIIVGAANSLKGVDYLKTIELNQEKGMVEITVNGEDIKLTPFPNDIIASTIKGLVSSLKGGEDPKTILIKVNIK